MEIDNNTPNKYQYQDLQNTENILENIHFKMPCDRENPSHNSSQATDLKLTEVAAEAGNVKEPKSGERFYKTDDDGDVFNRTISSSDFNDADCGEPLRAQHLMIDFTPIEGVDDIEYVQKKCEDFWDFINKQPIAHNFDVYPLSATTLSMESEATVQESEVLNEDKVIDNIATPALDWLTNKRIINNLQSIKDGKYCEDGEGDYCDTKVQKNCRKNVDKKRDSNISKVYSGVLTNPGEEKKLVASARHSSQYDLKLLCKEMEEWDLDHPKSMDAPGHPPPLIHAALQENRQTMWK